MERQIEGSCDLERERRKKEAAFRGMLTNHPDWFGWVWTMTLSMETCCALFLMRNRRSGNQSAGVGVLRVETSEKGKRAEKPRKEGKSEKRKRKDEVREDRQDRDDRKERENDKKKTDDRDNTPGPKRRGGARKRALTRGEDPEKREEGRRVRGTSGVGWRRNGQRPIRRQTEDEGDDGQKGQDTRNERPCDQH